MAKVKRGLPRTYNRSYKYKLTWRTRKGEKQAEFSNNKGDIDLVRGIMEDNGLKTRLYTGKFYKK